MAKIVSVMLLILFVACNSSEEKKKESENISEEITIENTDGVNNFVEDPEEEGSKMIVGSATLKALQSEPFNEWYKESENNHILDTVTLKKVEPLLKNKEIKIFMGTWCEDSQREIPALFKILDHVDYNYEAIDLYAVSRDKDTPEGYEEGLNIAFVPTIIFLEDGEELGRIVEYTQESLEKDMYAILSGADYKHAYSD